MATLYIVATPIGNLEDITLRALRILGEVDLIAAEDTRKTRQLLNVYGIKTALTSYHEHNKQAKGAYLLKYLQKQDIALVSEAGTPGMNDPGYELIVAAAEQGIAVVPVPGASVVVTALVISGLPTDRFLYVGFLPRRKTERSHLLKNIATEPCSIIALEAPHRLLMSLGDILQVLGDRRIAVCREVTKKYEEVFRGKVSQALEHFIRPRGEFTLVIEGKQDEEAVVITPNVEAELGSLYRQGFTAKEAIAHLTATTHLPRRELYRSWLNIIKS